jgi:hypothetical protein
MVEMDKAPELRGLFFCPAELPLCVKSQYYYSRITAGGTMPRLTLDVDEKFNDNLTRLAAGTTKAEVIRRALASYQYLKSQVPDHSGDKRISITDATGSILKDVILP